MKGILQRFTISICVTSLAFVSYSCTKPATDGGVPGTGALYSGSGAALIDAYQMLTEGRFIEAIEAFSEYREQIDAEYDAGSISLEIGMGKAYFGAGDYRNAMKSFGAAHNIDSERNDIIHYLGQAQMQAGDYPGSVESFRLLFERDPEDLAVLGKLAQALRKNRDYTSMYQLFLGSLESVDDGDSPVKNYYLRMLLEAAQLTKDSNLIRQAVEQYKNTPQELAVKTGFEAYELLISGDEESAKAVIFDVNNIDALVESAGRDGCYFGGYSDTGEYQGKGLIIFGSNSRYICQVYFGEFSGNKPNGAGMGYSGYAQKFEDKNGKYNVNKENNYIESGWIDGIPDGIVVKTDEYLEYFNGVLQYSGKIIETALYKDGVAQGEVWSENRESNPGASQKSNVSYTKHVVENGWPVSFEVTIRGKTVMAYEAYYDDPKSEAFFTCEEECQNCRFYY